MTARLCWCRCDALCIIERTQHTHEPVKAIVLHRLPFTTIILLLSAACYYPQIESRPHAGDANAGRSASRPAMIEPSPRRVQEGIYHPVGKGETLWRICKTYNVSLQEVAELNFITDASQIKAGDSIFIPGARQVRAVNLADNRWGKAPEPIKQPKGRFIWPVEGRVVGHYGVKSGSKYDGIDIQAPLGTAVKAADAGKVAFVNTLPGYGNIIIIKHSDKYSTVYAHNQLNLAKEGSWVRQGAVIARVGNSHNSASSPTLHFQIRRYNKARNPLFYLH